MKYYNGNQNLKRAGEPVKYTKIQVAEYIKCRDDVIYFAENYMKIVNLDLGLINIPLYDYQKDFLRTLQENRFVAAIQARQSGKSTTLTIDILHYILFNEHKTTVILANKAATAREIFSRVQLAYEHLPKWLQQGVIEWNKGSCKLENGSRCICAASSGSAIRGMSVDYLFVDEVAFVEHWDDFFASVYPTIASGKNSRIVLVSTANGLNHFYKIVTDARNGRNDFKLIEVTWRDVPNRDEEWRRQTIANTSEEAFLQEHENHFLGNALTLISSSKLRCLVEKNPLKMTGSMRIYKDPIEDHAYVIPVDTSRGKGLDKSAFSVIDITTYPFEQVATFYDDSISPLLYPSFIETIAKRYNMAHVLVETNDIGESVATTMHYDLEYENILSPAINGKYEIGIRTTKSVKAVGCSTFRDLMENDMLIVHDKNTIIEMSGFIQKGKSYEADDGFHDDLVMGLVLFSWLTCQDAFEEFRQDFSLRKSMFGEEAEQFSEDMMPAAYIEDGIDDIPTTTYEDGVVWTNTLI